MKKKILIVSIAFPPKCDPESLQVSRYLKYLLESDFTVDAVTTSNPTLYMETDKKFTELFNRVQKVSEIKLKESRYINYFLRKVVPRVLEFPDSKFSFHLANPKVDQPNILYSRSYPVSSTLLALKFKKKWPSIPWVLHLSDPWSISFDGDSPATRFYGRSKKWNEKKEKECFRMASKISLTSNKTIALYKIKYPEFADKFFLTPNVFDDDFLNYKEVDFNGDLNILCTGGFGEKRDPQFYLSTIAQFLAEHSETRHLYKFNFTGPLTQKNKVKFEKYKGVPEIQHLGLVEYDEMLKMQYNAHVLVNIDSNITDPIHSVFFPSKLLEYMAANRRVLAITNTHSVTHDLVHGEMGDCIDFEDSEKLKQMLEIFLLEFQDKNAKYFSPKKDITTYGAKWNVNILLDHFRKLL